jgi:hypothetical protein
MSDTPKTLGCCFECENWEPKYPEGHGPKRQLAMFGYCPVFQKQTESHHGKQCTAWERSNKTLAEVRKELDKPAKTADGLKPTGKRFDSVEQMEAHYKQSPEQLADWDITRVANVVANCRQQIGLLRMKMPMNVALALGRADEALADAQSWMRQESNFGTYANPPNEK